MQADHPKVYPGLDVSGPNQGSLAEAECSIAHYPASKRWMSRGTSATPSSPWQANAWLKLETDLFEVRG